MNVSNHCPGDEGFTNVGETNHVLTPNTPDHKTNTQPAQQEFGNFGEFVDYADLLDEPINDLLPIPINTPFPNTINAPNPNTINAPISTNSYC